jgi:hypothetical protein
MIENYGADQLIFNFGDEVGEFSAIVYASLVQRELAAMPDDEREAADSSIEWHNERIAESFDTAVGEWANKTPDPTAFTAGWRMGFKAKLRQLAKGIERE